MRPLHLALCLVLSLGLAQAQSTDPDWPLYRHDPCLSGRSPLKGSITTPAVLSSYDLRALDNLLIAGFSPAHKASAALRREPWQTDYLSSRYVEWGLASPRYDLAGDGKLTGLSDAMYTRYAKLLPNSPGLQKIHNDDYFGTGTPDKRKLYAYTFEPGQPEPKLLWESGPWGELEGTTLTIVDADGDGLPEIVGNTWGRLFVWNGQTGAQKLFLQWHPPKRDYGYFAAVKLTPQDKVPQFVVIGDFVTHLDVIGNDGKTLKVLWSKDVESILGGKYKACRPLVNSALDIDGDGYTEVLANLFNDTGDNRWHLMAYEGTTGKAKLDVPDVYAYAAQDVTGDGVPELFCSKTSGQLLPDPAALMVGAVIAGKLQWGLVPTGAGMFEFTEVKQQPLYMNTMAANGTRTVRLADADGDGQREFFISRADALEVYGANAAGKLVRKGAFYGPRLHVVGTRQRAAGSAEELLLQATPTDGEKAELRGDATSLEPVSCTPRAGPVSPPVAAHLSRAQGLRLLVQDALNRLVCLQSESGALRPAWSTPGRGISADASTYYGVCAADLDGDDTREVVFGRPGADGTAELVAVRGDGRTVWTHSFPGFGGAAPVWNANGLTHWSVGHYSGRGGMDVAVSLRRSSMHTDETHLLDGRTGRELWCNPFSMTVGSEKRGFGGSLTAAYDYNGDGCEDLLSTYPDEYYVASGKTGELLLAKQAMEIFPGGWLAYALPLLGPWLEGGKPGIMWTQGAYRRGLMTLQGERVWTFDYMDGYGSVPGIGDVNADGKLEALSSQKQATTCYDLPTGNVRWTFPQPQSTDAVCADLNGDGRDEFLFGSGKQLLAVNETDGKPNLVWSLPLSAGSGPPVVADVDGDDKAEIIVMTRDGLVQVVGEKR